MTDEKGKPDDAPETKVEGPAGGERLAEARREKQISVLEIAKELHVEEGKIRALENNDFDALGAPVFAKGHLKKYAQLVGVNHDDVLADYYRLTRSQEMPPVVVKRQKPGRELSPGPWIAVVVVVVFLALAYWLLVESPFGSSPASAVTEPAASESAPAGEPEPADDESAVESAAESADEIAEEFDAEPEGETGTGAQMPVIGPGEEPAEPEVASAEPAPPVTQQAAQPAALEGDVRLSVTFLGDCWTEITDASGRRLFFQLGRSGRTVNVSGNAPVSVLFGDADNVAVRINGEDFIIPPSSRRGRTARFTIPGT
jgi:cytoskeleton protein RodZ